MGALHVAADGNEPQTAGAIVRPPLLFLALLVLGFGLDHLMPLPRPIPGTGLSHSISALAAGILAVAGAFVFGAAIRNMSRANTPVQGTRPTSALVTTGIYRWSRNPIYLGMLLAFVAVGTLVRSPWILILALPLAIILRYGVVAHEERYLERRFGEDYYGYKARVRRWL